MILRNLWWHSCLVKDQHKVLWNIKSHRMIDILLSNPYLFYLNKHTSLIITHMKFFKIFRFIQSSALLYHLWKMGWISPSSFDTHTHRHIIMETHPICGTNYANVTVNTIFSVLFCYTCMIWSDFECSSICLIIFRVPRWRAFLKFVF